MKNLIIFILSLNSTTVLAHVGHVSDESVHSFLHVEHIIVLTAIGLIAYLIKQIRGK